MDLSAFEDCLDRFGSKLSAWPQPERDEGLSLLSSSSEARDLLAEASILAGVLAAPSIKAPAGLANRIISKAVKPAPVLRPIVPVEKPSLWSRLANTFPLALQPTPALALPVCFIVGLLVGVFSGSGHVSESRLDLPSFVAQLVDSVHYAD